MYDGVADGGAWESGLCKPPWHACAKMRKWLSFMLLLLSEWSGVEEFMMMMTMVMVVVMLMRMLMLMLLLMLMLQLPLPLPLLMMMTLRCHFW